MQGTLEGCILVSVVLKRRALLTSDDLALTGAPIVALLLSPILGHVTDSLVTCLFWLVAMPSDENILF